MNRHIISLFLLLSSLTTMGQSTFLKPQNPAIVKSGRIDTTLSSGAYRLFWPGTSLKLRFKGTEVKALLKEQYPENYYTVIIDDDSVFTFNPDSIKHYYTLVTGIPYGDHTVELFKRTGWMMGWTDFYGFELGDHTIPLQAPPPPARKIEFFGNSITVGISNEPGAADSTGEEDPYHGHTNDYYSYAAITARHYHAASTTPAGVESVLP